jgi:cytochrome c oxidase subunit 2
MFIFNLILFNKDILKNFKSIINLSNCDSGEEFSLFMQDPATPIMEGLLLFNDHLLIVITSIILLIIWGLCFIIFYFTKTNEFIEFYHSTKIEIFWTVLPATILLTLASPSFTLLYSMDEIINPEISLKVIGHQWFWSYEISDFNSCKENNKSFKFSSYMLTDEELNKNKNKYTKGCFRILETNKRVVLPASTHIRLLVSAVDVLHSWTIPSFGLKIDACPGRLNQSNLFLKRLGIFYGQCSEICGVNHGFMPIVIVSVPSIQFNFLILSFYEFEN